MSGLGVDSTKPNGSSTPALCHTLVLSSSSSISRPGVDSTNPTESDLDTRAITKEDHE